MSIVKEIDSTELNQKLESGSDLYLLDIRSDAEVMHGMLPDATHLPMHLLPLRASEFPRDREIVLYCRSGARSYHACMFLMQQGYSNVINLKGGIIDWARRGLPVAPYSR